MDKRKFQFGKREDELDDEEEKRKFQFGKRKFQFGKRGDEEELDDEIEDYKRKFQFGKRKFQFGKRKFQFGKRDEEGEAEMEEADEQVEKRPFGPSGYRIGKRSVDYLMDMDKRPFGNSAFKLGKRYIDDDDFDNDDEYEYSDLEKRPFGSSSFQFGKRTSGDWDPYDAYLQSNKRHPIRPYQLSGLLRNGRKFLLGKRFEDDIVKRKKILLGRRAFGGNVYHWKTGITDFSNFNSDPPLSLSDSEIEEEKRAFGGGVNNLFG